MSGAETGLSSSALSSLGGQQTHACSSQRLLFPQIIAYFIYALSLSFCFPLQPCILRGKQLSMSTQSASIMDYKLYCPGLTVPEKKSSLLVILTGNTAFSSLCGLPERFPNAALRFPNNLEILLFSLSVLWPPSTFVENISIVFLKMCLSQCILYSMKNTILVSWSQFFHVWPPGNPTFSNLYSHLLCLYSFQHQM